MILFDNFQNAEKLLRQWFEKNHRKLPWRENRTPYRVWVSEIMLQQTQVATVEDYYNRFMQHFPNLASLAAANEDQVLALWSGLGYYSRARNLHKTAGLIEINYAGQFPEDFKTLQKLPGIGSYTAGAILAFAYQQAAAVVDGNVARVFSRLLADKTPWGDSKSKKYFEAISLKLAKQASDVQCWQEALMELGALICTPKNPNCSACPLSKFCESRILGSQTSYPVLIPKRQKERLDLSCQLIHDPETGSIWLEKAEAQPLNSNLFKGLYVPPCCHSELDPGSSASKASITYKRTLTHKHLYLHAKLVPMSQVKNPSPNWFKKSELAQIGIPAAIKGLLQKALLIGFAGLFFGCSLKPARVRYLPRSTHVQELNPVKFAQSQLGRPFATYDDQIYDADAPDTIKAFYEASGMNLNEISSVEELFAYTQEEGRLHKRDPQSGDLVFFKNGVEDQVMHVGLVEKVLEDGTVVFIHHLKGVIIRSRLNLSMPAKQINASTNQRVNHVLRKTKNHHFTTGELFMTYGSFS